MKVHSRANQAFRQAAHSVTRAHSSIGAYYRAMRARRGPKQAIVATAHKIARTVYHLLKTASHIGKKAMQRMTANARSARSNTWPDARRSGAIP